jgi:hypothetical protein
MSDPFQPIDPVLVDNAMPIDYTVGQEAYKKIEQKQVIKQACNPQDNKNRAMYMIYGTQAALAVIGASLTAVLLYIINPPITQKKRPDSMTCTGQDWRKVFLMAFIVLLLIILIPELFKLAKLLK